MPAAPGRGRGAGRRGASASARGKQPASPPRTPNRSPREGKATRTRPSSRLAAQQADDAEELEERGASPDMMETCVQMSVVLHGQFSGAWYIPRQEPLSKTLLEAFCNSHDIKDRSKVTFETRERVERGAPCSPVALNCDLSPDAYRMEGNVVVVAVVIPETHIAVFVLHPFCDDNKKFVRLKIRADVKLQHVVDLSFGAFELPSYYRPYIQYCFDNQLILPEHCQSRLDGIGIKHNSCLTTRYIPIGGKNEQRAQAAQHT